MGQSEPRQIKVFLEGAERYLQKGVEYPTPVKEWAQYAVGLLADSAEEHFSEVIRGSDLATMT